MLPEKNFEIVEGVFCEVSDFRGKKRVDIRRWYQDKDGEWQRTRKGINLDMEEFGDFASGIDDVKKFVEENG